MRAFVCLCLFLSLILVYDLALGDAPYLALLVMFVGAGLVLLAGAKRTFLGRLAGEPLLPTWPTGWDAALRRLLTWLWMPVVVSWCLGVVIGLLNGVNPAHVFRNFFGLVVFVVFPLLVLIRVSATAVMDTVLVAGFVQMVYGMVSLFSFDLDTTALLAAASISDLRAIYSAGFIVIFPVYALGLVHLLCPRGVPDRPATWPQRIARSPLTAGLAFAALVVPAMSKGFILATIILTVTLASFSFLYWRRGHRFATPIWIGVLLAITGLVVLPKELLDFILASFGSEEMGNALRSEQADHLVADFSLFGRGLGASLPSGYARDDTGYGFELTYLNLIHKLGILSTFLFAMYALTLALSLLRLWRGIRVSESAFALGCTGYLVVGAGNPLLLAPTAVVLQCIAMYLLVAPGLPRSSRRRVRPPSGTPPRQWHTA